MKTPITELISTIDILISVLPENALGAKNQLIIVKSKATELLPKEKEVIEESYIAGGNYSRCCSLISKDIKDSSKTYFNKTFTQK